MALFDDDDIDIINNDNGFSNEIADDITTFALKKWKEDKLSIPKQSYAGAESFYTIHNISDIDISVPYNVSLTFGPKSNTLILPVSFITDSPVNITNINVSGNIKELRILIYTDHKSINSDIVDNVILTDTNVERFQHLSLTNKEYKITDVIFKGVIENESTYLKLVNILSSTFKGARIWIHYTTVIMNTVKNTMFGHLIGMPDYKHLIDNTSTSYVIDNICVSYMGLQQE